MSTSKSNFLEETPDFPYSSLDHNENPIELEENRQLVVTSGAAHSFDNSRDMIEEIPQIKPSDHTITQDHQISLAYMAETPKCGSKKNSFVSYFGSFPNNFNLSKSKVDEWLSDEKMVIQDEKIQEKSIFSQAVSDSALGQGESDVGSVDDDNDDDDNNNNFEDDDDDDDLEGANEDEEPNKSRHSSKSSQDLLGDFCSKMLKCEGKKKYVPRAPLIKVCNNLLKGIEPNDQDLQQLDDIELTILNCIKEKKFYTDEERNIGLEVQSDQLKSMVSGDIEIIYSKKKPGKRVEENQKMFFKRAFSAIDKNFFKKKMKNKKKIQKRHKNYQEFYEHYFREVSDRLKIPFENFYHPQRIMVIKPREQKKPRSKKGKASACIEQEESTVIPGIKSFNQTYIELTLRSEVFRCDVRNYLNNGFLQEYAKERAKKLEKFLSRCLSIADALAVSMLSMNAKASMESLRPQILSKIHENIIKDSKAKIPWSDSELESARKFARMELDKYEDKFQKSK